MAKLLTDLFYTAIDLNGNVLAGAKLEFFITGTSTPLAIFTDDALAVAHTNPVIADSAGRFAPIYLQDADYKAILSTSADVVIDTIDPVHGAAVVPTTATLAKSVDYTVVAGDKGSMILVDASGGARTITLLTATADFTLAVKKTDSSANTVTIDGSGAETIDGALTLVLEAQYDAANLRSDGTSWHTEGEYDEFPPATAAKTASYEVLTTDLGRTLLVDATTVTFDAGIQEDNSGSSFIDETTDLNDAGANDVAVFPAGAGDNDAFYFGSAGKFAGIACNTGTAGIGTYAVTWEYWDGGNWVALAGVVDGTTGFQTALEKNVTFQVPSDWTANTVNSQGPFFYIRARRNAGTVTTDPLITQAKVFTTVLLPAAATARTGFTVSIVKIDSSNNAVIVSADGSDTINGQLTLVIEAQHRVVELVCDAVEWFVKSGSGSTSFDSALLHVQDEKAANTAGGTFTLGAWRTRDLNTVKTNEIFGASLSSNQITLPAGTYYIDASCPGYAVSRHKTRLENTTDTMTTLLGTSEHTNTTTSDTVTRSFIKGRFTIASEKIFEIQHRSLLTTATTGFGQASNFGVTEVYSIVQIWKVG